MNSPERRIDELGLELPPLAAPKGVYRSVITVGETVTTAGHLPVRADGSLVTGKVGEQLDVATGCEAARLAGLAILTSVRAELGSLDRVKRLIKVLGFVNCTSDFIDQPAVINGCSELFHDVFGEQAGLGARSAVGVSSLPLGVAVEIEAIFEISQ
jgi:enamine deaminase RidA (YjgF/YER057c/UK114 family)